MATRYYEDLSIGESHSLGPRTVTADEIIEFAEQYDPQPIHVDTEVAADSSFGGLIASGWHTAAVSMRLLVDGLLDDVAVVAAIGIDELRWRKPLRANDKLSITTTVADRDGWDEDNGLVTFDVTATNQEGNVVMTRSDLVLVERGPKSNSCHG